MDRSVSSSSASPLSARHAALARTGQVPPAASAMAINGSQTSAARSSTGTSGTASVRSSSRGATQAASLPRTSCSGGTSRRSLNGLTCSLRARRLKMMLIARSVMVSGMSPIPAVATMAEGGELLHLLVWANTAQRVPAAAEPGVEELAQILRALGGLLSPDRIGLVHDQGWRVVVVDGPEQRSDGRIDGRDRLVARVLDHIQEPGLAAPLHRGADTESGGVLPRRLGVSGRDPQRDRISGFRGGKHYVIGHPAVQLVEEGGPVHQGRFGEHLVEISVEISHPRRPPTQARWPGSDKLARYHGTAYQRPPAPRAWLDR